MKLICDSSTILTANINSSTANSTSVQIDKATGISVSATITDSTPSAKTFIAGVKEVFTITSPAENAVKEVCTITCPAENAVKEVFTIDCIAASAITTGTYFTFYSALDAIAYYGWYRKDGAGADPAPVGKTGVMIDILAADTDAQVATKTATAIDALAGHVAAAVAAQVTVTNARTGATTNAADVDVGGAFTITTTVAGVTSVLNGKYATIYTALDAIKNHLWFNTNGEGTDPNPGGGSVGIEVTTAIGDSANTVADSVAAALDALAGYVAPNPAADVVTCTNAKTGATTNIANVNVGAGFSVATTVAGVTSVLNGKYFTIDSSQGYPVATIPYYVWFNTNSEGSDPAVAGKTGVTVATAIGDTDAQVATKVSAAIDALAGFVCPDTGTADSVVTAFSEGLMTDAANVNVGAGFSIAIGTQGTQSFVDLVNDKISIASHGFLTGLLGRLTTTTTLPTGLSLATDYFVIRSSADEIQLATSLANALAGTAVNITAVGVGTHTFTPTAALAGSLIVQGSNDDSTWVTPTGSQYTQAYSAAGNFLFNLPDLYFKHVRLRDSVTSGQSTVTATLTSKGDAINP